jgi:AraC-like DNA-binding protein
MATHARSDASGYTVSADLIRGVIDCAVQCGMPRARFADILRDESEGLSPSTRYAAQQMLNVWERVLRLSDDPIIAFRMAQFAGPKTFGVLGEIWPRCATLFDAYKQTERYAALASQAARVAAMRDASTLTISIGGDIPSGPVYCAIMLWGLTNVSLAPAYLTGATVRPKSVACAFPSPGPVAARTLREHFPVTFDQSHNRVVFDRSVGELHIPSADADLQSLLAEVMERHLEKLGPAASFERGLTTILREMMNGTMPTLASLSERAGMSQRTLQRRLGEANTSFKKLLQQVLQEAAEDLLARGHLSQGEIAFLLGYSEVSAFSHAYRSWTGHAPGAARLRPAVQR